MGRLDWLDFDNAREDLRKIGIALIAGGFIGGIIEGDHVSRLDGIALFSIGVSIWGLGLKKGGAEK